MDISIKGTSPIVTNNMTVGLLRSISGSAFTMVMAGPLGAEICRNSFKSDQFINLKKTTKQYDVIITELFGTDCMLGWAWYFGVPSIVMTSSANLPWASERFGLPDNPSYVPNYFMEYLSIMSLYERIVNTWTLIQSKLLYHIFSTWPSNVMAKEFFGEELPDLDVLAQNTSLQFVNTHISINNARALVPNVIEVAGLHIKKSHQINEYFNKILTTDKKGVIYFSMGSVLVIETLPEEKLQVLLDTFAELPYKILVKGSKERFSKDIKIPENVHLEPWMPQQDILCDSRVKLFVSHGGMMGTQEAIYCGVPVLGIPIFADQSLNIKYAETVGYAIMVDYEDISKERLLGAARKLLEDPRYAANAKQISEDYKDRPLSPMETAVYWVEYVIRHKGAPRLSSAAKYLKWYQYYLLDVFVIIIGIPLVILFVIIKFVRFYKKFTDEKIKKTL
ncbi:UDP-glucosyltransferase 2-like isoform X2 [Euwallacea fornicatus]|uniref:UDP-glucosyltransferase 2-like isoform X2 n=1 Tax=Euwallacea fornicatus TaxID=995702 RepID=UPI00338D4811